MIAGESLAECARSHATSRRNALVKWLWPWNLASNAISTTDTVKKTDLAGVYVQGACTRRSC